MRLDVKIGLLFATLVATAVCGSAAGFGSQQVRRLVDGEGLFRAYCASCHGRSGKGDGPAARALKTPPPDLTRIAQRSGGQFPRERVERFIELGDSSAPAHGSKEMPVWGPTFGGLAPGSFQPVNPRIQDVVSYIDSIQAK